MRFACSSSTITPSSPAPLAGAPDRVRPFLRIESQLEANVIAFEDGDGRRALIASIDCLFVGDELHQLIVACAARHGIMERDVVTLASHTHFAPQFDRSRDSLGHFVPAVAHTSFAAVASAVDAAASQPMRSMKARKGARSIAGAVHRRRPWFWPSASTSGMKFKRITMGPNPSKAIDKGASVLIVIDDHDQPCAILWRWSCHPTSQPDRLAVSSEFPGAVRAELRNRFGDQIPVLYCPGFAGDIRPAPEDFRSPLRKTLETLRFGPRFAAFTIEGYQQWCRSIAIQVSEIVCDAADASTAGTIRSAAADIPISFLLPGVTYRPDVAIRRLQIGDVIEIVAIAAEPVNDLKKLVPYSQAWACGYFGEAFGYWPTELQIAEGGYESRDMLKVFALKGPFAPNTDRQFADAMDNLSKLS